MGFPEHMCTKAMTMTGGDVEAAANYIMGNLDQPEEFWFRPPGGAAELASQLISEASLGADELAMGGEGGEEAHPMVEALLQGLDPERREAFADVALAALAAIRGASASQIAELGIEEEHAALLREPLPRGAGGGGGGPPRADSPPAPDEPPRRVSPPRADAPPPPGPPAAAEEAAPDRRSSGFSFGGPDLAAVSAPSALEEALDRARRVQRGPGPGPGPPRRVADEPPASTFAEMEDDGSESPAFLLCGGSLEIEEDGLQVRRGAEANASHCWAATTSGRKYVEVVVESVSDTLPKPGSDSGGPEGSFGGSSAEMMVRARPLAENFSR